MEFLCQAQAHHQVNTGESSPCKVPLMGLFMRRGGEERESLPLGQDTMPGAVCSLTYDHPHSKPGPGSGTQLHHEVNVNEDAEERKQRQERHL